MVDDADGYQAYYAGKLWALLPEIYRTSDLTSPFDPGSPDQPAGPLRELVNRIGAQAATLRRSIDRLWEDQSIETCDDWVIPYIGAQLSVNLVASQDARSQRLDVARAIHYRQRKGTLPVLEEIAAAVTGWDVRVVEFYRRLGRARHGLDPPIGPQAASSGPIGRHTRTPAGGYADLRNDYGAGRAGTAYDEYSHTADMRTGRGANGWYNVQNLGIFLWRLISMPVIGVTPVASAGHHPHYTFDPTGRDIQLFASPLQGTGADWTPRPEYQLPVPIDRRLLRIALPELYATTDPATGLLQPNAIGLYTGPPAVSTLVPRAQVGDRPAEYGIDPVRGRIVPHRGAAALPAQLQVSYCHGFASTIGAGGYDRRQQGQPAVTVAPVLPKVTGGGGGMIATSGGTIEIGDSLTYDSVPDYTISDANGPNQLVVRASNLQRPLLRIKPPAHWTLTGSICQGTGSRLLLDGLFVSGCDIVLAGDFEDIVIRTCTLDPGSWHLHAPHNAIDGRPLVPSRLVITGTVRRLSIERCITGPVAVTGDVEQVRFTDSILQVVAPHEAIAIPAGITTIDRCTIMGKAEFRELEASNALFHGVVTVADNQQGCIRFSAFTKGSRLPRRYRCAEMDAEQNIFVSSSFGASHYGQLSGGVDPGIAAGAENGCEMGAFFRDQNPVKTRGLLSKLQEFMPIEVTPVLIGMT